MSARGATRILHKSRQRWGISNRTANAIFAVPFVILLGASILRLTNPSMLRMVMGENGPAEWLQVTGFSVGMVASAMTATHFFRAGKPRAALMYSILAGGLFFTIGEELCWGQLIIDIKTPDRLAAINVKSELSVHNIESVEQWFNVAKLMIGIYGAFGYAVLMWFDSLVASNDYEIFVVPSFLSSAFFVLLGLRLLRMTVLNQAGIANYGEYEELCLACGIAVFAVLGYRRICIERSRTAL
jgi:hypothetical protein